MDTFNCSCFEKDIYNFNFNTQCYILHYPLIMKIIFIEILTNPFFYGSSNIIIIILILCIRNFYNILKNKI